MISPFAKAVPMTIRVFLVEDVPALRALVGELLSTLGDFRVVETAATEMQARRWLDGHPGAWDVAVVDLVLEQGTGMSVIAHCRKVARQAKVVVFSDYASPGIRQHCLALGADAVFQKGLDVSGFADFLAQLGQSGPQPWRSA